MMKSTLHLVRAKFPRTWNTLRLTKKLIALAPRAYGYEPRACPICSYEGRFLAEVHFPDIFVYDAVCPVCSSQPRNRLLKLAVDRFALAGPDKRLLHFAAERPVMRFLRPLAGEYKTADLFARPVDLVLNIEHIEQPDDRWDLIVCSHVLEHVDHVKALAELHRVLAPGGKLLALFPVVDGWDAHYENPDLATPRERAIHFGKDNHVRRFGANVRADFERAGFRLSTYAPIGADVVRYGLIPGETLFIGEKAA